MDTTDPIFSQSLKWANYIRKDYPTMLFYFAQTYNQTIVIFYTDDKDDVQVVYTKLCVDSISSACELPDHIYDTYFRLIPVPRDDDGVGSEQFLLPGVLCAAWTRARKKLVQGTRVLVNITGIVDVTTKAIDSVYLVFIDKTTKSLAWEQVECAPHIKGCISDMTGASWSSLKTVLGMSK
jgi:hypothetical protein